MVVLICISLMISDADWVSFYVSVNHMGVFLKKMSVQICCRAFDWIVFCYWVVWVFKNIFDINSLSDIYDLEIFSSHSVYCFFLLLLFFLNCLGFLFDTVPLVCFCFFCFGFWYHVQKIISCQARRFFSYVFFWDFHGFRCLIHFKWIFVI